MKLKASELAVGRWPAILTQLGVPPEYLKRSHGPCPICRAGTDRYRFIDYQGRGTYYCSQCRPGDGMSMLMKVHNWDYATAAREVEKIVGVCPVSEAQAEYKDPEKIKANISRYWKEATSSTIVTDYLKSRGLSITSKALRGHSALNYLDKSTGELRKEKAVVALVLSSEGKVTTMHRTFLLGDGKRDKRLYKTIPDTWLGGCIRLFPEHRGHIALAEGIETALAIHEFTKTHIPTWATVTAQGMEVWELPEGETIKRVSIFGDHDPHFRGQKAAYTLAHKLTAKGIKADVWIPKNKGDWLDVFAANN